MLGVLWYPTNWESRRTQKWEPKKPGGQQVENLAQATERKEYPEASKSRHALHGVPAKNHRTPHEIMTGKFEYCFN